MARDYVKLVRGEGVLVPRWLLTTLLALALLFVAFRILVPPSDLLQRLDSPDGERAARLLRVSYLKSSFAVQLKDGPLWHTAYYSPPLTNDYRVDLGERLAWSADGHVLLFRYGGRWVWGRDTARGRDLTPAELDAAGGVSNGWKNLP